MTDEELRSFAKRVCQDARREFSAAIAAYAEMRDPLYPQAEEAA